MTDSKMQDTHDDDAPKLRLIAAALNGDMMPVEPLHFAPTVKFKRLEHGAGIPLPAYATDGAACMDVHSAVTYYIRSGEMRIIPTGFAVAVPDGWELLVRPRSGLAAKQVITVLNTPGTIDSDYRGELMVILINHGPSTHYIKRGDRIAQLSLKRVERFAVCEVYDLDETARGAGGFGSTGA